MQHLPKRNQQNPWSLNVPPSKMFFIYDDALIWNRIVQMSSTSTAAFNISDDYYCYSNLGKVTASAKHIGFNLVDTPIKVCS